MNGKQQVTIFLPSSSVFPDLLATPLSLCKSLRNLSLRHTILWCARIMRAVTLPINRESQDVQRDCVNYTFNESELKALQSFDRINPRSFVTVFFRSQLLETIRWALVCADWTKDQPSVNVDAERTDLLKSLLICSDLWGERTFKGMSPKIGDLANDRRKSIVFFRRSRESASSLSVVNTYSAVVRSWGIYQNFFLQEYPDFDEEFIKNVGISYREFYYCQLLIWSNLINPNRVWAHIDISSVEGHPFEIVLKAYFNHQGQLFSELRNRLWSEGASRFSNKPMSLRPFYDKPVLITEDQRLAVVPDPIAFVESMYAGPLFTILAHAKNSGRIFDAYGKAFERYACSILTRIYPESSLHKRFLTDLNIKTSDGTQFQIDACLNDIHEVVVLEMKAVHLREDKLLNDDNEAFLAHLSERYIQNQEGDPKGVLQLSNIIRYISQGKLEIPGFGTANPTTVYPVLVVNDNYLDTGLFGNFLAKEFAISLGHNLSPKVDELCVDGLRVKHLTILTIEDFETLESSFKSFALIDLLNSYSNDNPERLMSVHNYVTFSKFGKMLIHNQSLASRASILLQKATKAVFG